jgi:hemolysin activation/secretion protein
MTSSLVKRLAGLLLLFLLAPRIAATQEPPKFLIETIVVQGVSRAAGRQIVTEESLLKPGQTYSEQELRQAVYRVKRLPFVVEAEFSLRKGSERGAYELVITVEEATPVFFLADAHAYRAQLESFNTGKKKTSTTWQRDGTLGGRVFVGSHGLVYGSVEKAQHQDGELVQGGYTQYDLFGAGSFAGTEIDSVQGTNGKNDQLRIFLSGGIPLTATQSLRADLGWQRLKSSIFSEQTSEEIGRLVDLAWGYNTTDDPLFPMSGSSASVSVTYRKDADHLQESTAGFQLDARSTVYGLGIGAGGWHYWPLTARQSLELGATLNRQTSAYAHSPLPSFTSWQGTLAAGHSVSLWGYEKTQRFGDLRFENVIVVSYYDDNGAFRLDPNKSADFVSSLGYRSRWGVLRLSFTYVALWTNR